MTTNHGRLHDILRGNMYQGIGHFRNMDIQLDSEAVNVKDITTSSSFLCLCPLNRAPVAQLVEHRAAMREVVSSTPARTNTQGLKITEEKVLPL